MKGWQRSDCRWQTADMQDPPCGRSCVWWMQTDILRFEEWGSCRCSSQHAWKLFCLNMVLLYVFLSCRFVGLLACGWGWSRQARRSLYYRP